MKQASAEREDRTVKDNDFPPGDHTRITGYHAHIYYDEETRETAARLRGRIWEGWGFDIVMGRFRDRPVGPHPEPMFQVAFDKALFAEFVPWLMYNRDGLVVLVHPEAEDAHDDHVYYPLWLGGFYEVRREFLRSGQRSA